MHELAIAQSIFDTVCWIVMGPYPSTIEGWFTALQNDRALGLLLLSFPTLFGMVLYNLTLLGLRNTLSQVNSISQRQFDGQ